MKHRCSYRRGRWFTEWPQKLDCSFVGKCIFKEQSPYGSVCANEDAGEPLHPGAVRQGDISNE